MNNSNLNYNKMKKVLFILFLLVTSLTVDAQVNFMGIPVDGTKRSMISKLEKMGFLPEETTKDYEEVQEEILKLGGKLDEGHIRDNDEPYLMEGFFDGKSCYLIIYVYKKKVYQIGVFFKNSIKSKIGAFSEFNGYADILKNKYFDGVHGFYQKLDYDENTIPIDGEYSNFFLVSDNKSDMYGGVSVHITYSSDDFEYYLFIRYINIENMPKGEDL